MPSLSDIQEPQDLAISGLDEADSHASPETASSAQISDVWEAELSHSGMRITFQNLEYLVRNRQKRMEKLPILRNISGFYLPSEMSAVMGPSGSGQSVPCVVLTSFLHGLIDMQIAYSGVL